jgi:hypothetical protein
MDILIWLNITPTLHEAQIILLIVFSKLFLQRTDALYRTQVSLILHLESSGIY